MIPLIDAPSLPSVDRDPVALRYRRLFAVIAWSAVPTKRRDPSTPGPKPHPPEAYLKALLVKIIEQKPSIPALRDFLVEHPALVLELGFRPVLDASQPFGIDIERMVPCRRWLSWHQQHDGPAVSALLGTSVHALQEQDPSLGEVVALDTTHHYAWVRQNNQNQTVSPRFQRAQQPPGDPDCRLGGKKRHPTPNRTITEAFWGYQSGIAATATTLGEVVVAAEVGPVVAQDVCFFPPLAGQLVTVLGHPPTHLTADAAFDAWQVYDLVAKHGGIAAIPANPRGGRPQRSADGHPLCDQDLVMTPRGTGLHQHAYHVRYYGCPLRGLPDAHCSHSRFSTGGCIKRINIEAGGLQRITLDRTSEVVRHIYAQRTLVERIFSRIKRWGLDRILARRLSTVTTILLLAYLAINLQALVPKSPPTNLTEGHAM